MAMNENQKALVTKVIKAEIARRESLGDPYFLASLLSVGMVVMRQQVGALLTPDVTLGQDAATLKAALDAGNIP